MRRGNVWLLLALCCGATAVAAGQPVQVIVTPGATAPASDVVRHDLNRVDDSHAALLAFQSRLREAQVTPRTKAVVLHLGDSHVEAGFFGAAVRSTVGTRIGSAGRGLILPTYRKRLVNRRGLAYYVRRSLAKPQATSSAEFQVTLREEEPSGFSRLVFFHERGARFLDFVVLDASGRTLGTVKSAGTGHDGPGMTVVPLAEAVRSVRVRTQRQRPAQKYAQVYAVSLEGEGGGLLYHSYGIVGATAETFVASPVLSHLLSGLQPDLVVVTLGTNDARRVPLDEGRLRTGFTDLVRAIRSGAPQAGIVLTSPPGSMRRLTRRGPLVADPGVDVVRRVQLDLAASLRLAAWDLFTIMGGPGSIATWKDRQLAAADLVHFTKEGYALQGSLFADALLAGLGSYADR